jgi:hypothetical protein
MPTWPFSPHTTFSDNTVPKVTATHINEWEAAHNALFWAVYLSRPQCRVYCTDGANVVGYVSPMVIKDTATSKYRYVGAGALSITPADLETPAASWPVSSWLYLYATCTHGVIGWEVSTTGPTVISPDGSSFSAQPLFKTGDETKRYICSFYSDGSSVLTRFHRVDNVTTYIDEAMVVPTSAGITTWQAVSLATYVPAHAVEVDLCGMLDNYAATYRSLYLTFTGDAPAAPRGIITRADSFNSANLGVYLIGAGFSWKTNSNAFDHEVRVAVRGWKD